MEREKQVTFIVNPVSGTQNKDTILKMIDEVLDTSKYDYTVRKTEYAGHASEIAAEASAKGVDIVVAIGGDGTVNEIGRSLIQTDTCMGIIPCGSGNGLARHLHIPLDPKGAIRLLNEGSEKIVDYGLIDGHPFFCTCGVGFDAFISLKFADFGRRGPLAYVENTLREILNYRPETYEIENSSGTVHHKAFLIACANASQYGNNAYIAPQASLTDGMLDITILEPFTVLDIPQLAFQLFNKALDQNSRIKTMRDKSIIIRRSREGVFHYDGDPIMGGRELKVEIVHQGLHVVAPSRPGHTSVSPLNILQHFSEFAGSSIAAAFSEKHRQFLEMNQQIFKKLSKE